MKSNTVSNNSNKSAPTTTTNRFSVSSGTSFVTARTGTSSTSAYQSADSRPHFLEDLVKNEDEDEEIDYSFLTGSLQPTNNDEEEHNSYQSDTESIQTVRPSTSQQPATAEKKGKQPMNTNVNHKKNKKFRHFNRRGHNKKQKSLLWKRAGSVFVSRQVPTVVTPNFEIIPTNQPIKKEPMLCMRSVTSLDSVEPSRYKAAKEARYDLLTEKWSQVQLVLTTSYIATYSSSVSIQKKKKTHVCTREKETYKYIRLIFGQNKDLDIEYLYKEIENNADLNYSYYHHWIIHSVYAISTMMSKVVENQP